MKKLLIVDDEENMRHMLQAMLKRSSYEVVCAENGVNATEIVTNEEFDFILCDVRMPDMDGLEFLNHNKSTLQNTTVIMMSAYGSIDLAIDAMKMGAYDFISKPFKTDEVLLALKKAEEREQLRKENRFLKSELDKREGGFNKIIGHSKEITASISLAEKVAPYDTTVLIIGESGTGKELFARGIHKSSPKGDKPFYAINCGSIPSELLESELFGYKKGAFTGADKNKKGLFEEADGSTLFLDEIGELPLDMQVKLLRVLQENEIRPVGSSVTKKIQVRIIAATGKDLSEEVKNGIFRQDLFYRLNVLNIQLPPLRNRTEDLPELCEHFIEKYNGVLKTGVSGVASEVMKKMMQYSWPGNIRELENVIQRGMVLTDDDMIGLEQLPANVTTAQASHNTDNFAYGGFSIKEAQKQLEAAMIQRALDETDGNKSKASMLLEISYPSLLNKIKEYNI